MFSTVAVLVYLLAFATPLLLLYRFRSGAWYWHALATLMALGMGFVRVPEEWHTTAFDLSFGVVFIFLLVWGVGGLFAFHHHHESHA